MPTPVTVRELCERLAITPDTFYRTRGTLHTIDKLPKPLTSRRPFKWDRATIDAWFGRNHPLAPPRAANDTAPAIAPDDVETWRAQLYADLAAH